MKVNIGKNTLGDSDKISVSIKEYGRTDGIIEPQIMENFLE